MAATTYLEGLLKNRCTSLNISLVNSDLLTRRGGYSSTFKLVGGEGGIRTHGTREGTPVFETGPFNHSGTPPH